MMPQLTRRVLSRISSGRGFFASRGLSCPRDVIWAVSRSFAGTTVAKKERASGRVPGVVFEHRKSEADSGKRLISANLMQVERLLHKLGTSFFLSRTFTLETYPHVQATEPDFQDTVLPRTVHFCAGTGNLLNITFMKISPDARVKVNLPLVFLGEDVCPGIKKGGYLNTIRRTACYDCPSEAIPEFLEVDLSTLHIGGTVLLKDIRVHPEMKIFGADGSWPVCKIMGSRHAEAE